jgi:phosphoglycolate phosphatase
MLNHESIIIWDWNGTLLDDVSICIDVMNDILGRRGMDKLTRRKYQQIFMFPVIEYYRQLGFDFERDSFEDLSVEFIDAYNRKLKDARLFRYSLDILGEFKARNYLQVIISAMKQAYLEDSLRDKKVRYFFDYVIGLDDHYAESKIDFAVDFITRSNIHVGKAILIGDTTHDYEVSRALGCKCLLVANGHQSYERLAVTGVTVKRSLKGIMDIFDN